MINKEDVKEYKRIVGLDEIVSKDLFYLIKTGLYRLIGRVNLDMTGYKIQNIRYEDIDKSGITSEDLEGFRKYLYEETIDRLVDINQDLNDGDWEFREYTNPEELIEYDLANYIGVATYVLGYQRGIDFNKHWGLKEECLLELEQGVDNALRDRNGHVNVNLKRQMENYRVKEETKDI